MNHTHSHILLIRSDVDHKTESKGLVNELKFFVVFLNQVIIYEQLDCIPDANYPLWLFVIWVLIHLFHFFVFNSCYYVALEIPKIAIYICWESFRIGKQSQFF